MEESSMSALQSVSVHSPQYEFDEFRVDVLQRTLYRNGSPVSISSKVFSLLLIFMRHHGVEITKENLMQALWPDSHVEPCNLTQAVFLLRRALGSEQRYVVTIPGQGYLFAGKVKASDAQISGSHGSANYTRSLAVIPFQMLNASAKLRYLGVGIADTLNNRLSHLREVRVRPMNMTDHVLKGHMDTLSLGRELAVDMLLTGSVQIDQRRLPSASRVRVSVQLTDIQNGAILWSDTIDHGLCQLLPLQDRLAEKIGYVLSDKLSTQERANLTRRYTQHAEAYTAYLKGRYHANQWTFRGLTKAIDCYSQAVEFDPDFALAYCGIADSHYVASSMYWLPSEVMPKAKAAAERALELDPSLAEAHTSLALVDGFYEWDWEKSEAGFRRAIMLNPADAAAYLWYGRLLTTSGRFDEGYNELKRAQLKDPLSSSINAEIGRTLFYAQKYKEAGEQLRETLELNSMFWPAHVFLAWVYEQQGLFTEALAILKQCDTLDDNPRTKAFLAVTHALAGEEIEAEKILAHLIEQHKQRYISPYYIALIYAALDDRDRAFHWLDRAYTDRSEWMVWLEVEPRFDMLRNDSRFSALLAKVKGPRNADAPFRIIDGKRSGSIREPNAEIRPLRRAGSKA